MISSPLQTHVLSVKIQFQWLSSRTYGRETNISIPHEQVAVDLVGPFPEGKGGCQYILTMACMASRWPNTKPLRSTSTKAVASAYVEIFLENRIPRQILSDNGPQFSSSTWNQVCKLLNVEQIHSAPCRPQSNGGLECLHRTLKASVQKALDSKKD